MPEGGPKKSTGEGTGQVGDDGSASDENEDDWVQEYIERPGPVLEKQHVLHEKLSTAVDGDPRSDDDDGGDNDEQEEEEKTVEQQGDKISDKDEVSVLDPERATGKEEDWVQEYLERPGPTREKQRTLLLGSADRWVPTEVVRAEAPQTTETADEPEPAGECTPGSVSDDAGVSSSVAASQEAVDSIPVVDAVQVEHSETEVYLKDGVLLTDHDTNERGDAPPESDDAPPEVPADTYNSEDDEKLTRKLPSLISALVVLLMIVAITVPLLLRSRNSTVPFNYVAFTSRNELHNAVWKYADESEHAAILMKYGNPIGSWDVSRIEDFGGVFFRCFDFAGYPLNVDVSGWDLSNGTNFTLMFGMQQFLPVICHHGMSRGEPTIMVCLRGHPCLMQIFLSGMYPEGPTLP